MSSEILYIVGTAGCGKSTMTSAVSAWMTDNGYLPFTVNLDPGADALPYEPDMDIREHILLSDVMAETGLGPNGAQVACADLLALKAPELAADIDGVESDLILVDTPGQIELFSFRHSSRRTVEAFGPDRSMLLYIFDPFLAQTAVGFVSELMLSATVEFRFDLPFLPVLGKADMVDEEVREKVLNWSDDPEKLNAALDGEEATMDRQLSAGLFRSLDDLGVYKSLIAASAKDGTGLGDIYAQVENIFHGGEDPERR